MMRQLIILALLAGAALVVASCRSTPKLVGDSWEVISVGGAAVRTSAEMPQAPMFRFSADSGRVMGYGGCNQFTGTFTQSFDSVRIGPLAATKRMCPQIDLETRIFDAINRTTTVDRSDDVLRFMDGDSILMECRSKVFPQSLP